MNPLLQVAAESCGMAQFDRGLTIGLVIGLAIAAEVYAFAWLERNERRAQLVRGGP